MVYYYLFSVFSIVNHYFQDTFNLKIILYAIKRAWAILYYALVYVEHHYWSTSEKAGLAMKYFGYFTTWSRDRNYDNHTFFFYYLFNYLFIYLFLFEGNGNCWSRTQIFSVERTEICARNYLLACEKLGLTKSKMASVEEIRTRISLREHDIINVSWTSVSCLKNRLYYTKNSTWRFVFFLQTHSTDFPGNYTGYDDTWSQENFEQVSELAPEIYSANSVVEA